MILDCHETTAWQGQMMFLENNHDDKSTHHGYHDYLIVNVNILIVENLSSSLLLLKSNDIYQCFY